MSAEPRDILAHIAAYKRQDVVARKALVSQTEIEAAAGAAPPVRGFARALKEHAEPGKPALIAEIKKASPSKGVIRPDFDPPSLAQAYAQGGAACLSVLTDGPSFQGDDAYVALAHAAAPTLPVLRKEFLVDPWQVAQSRALGADAILIIMAMIDDPLAADLLAEARRFGMDTLVEVHDEDEMARAIDLGGELLGVNNRDLKSFHVDLAVFERLAPMAPDGVVLVGESGVFTPADAARLANAGASAVLVGESLMRQADVTAATRALLA